MKIIITKYFVSKGVWYTKHGCGRKLEREIERE